MKESFFVFYSPEERQVYLWRCRAEGPRLVWAWDKDGKWENENYGPVSWGHIMLGAYE